MARAEGDMRVAFVTNLCPHYRRPLFEELARRFDLSFFFTSDGSEWYWNGSHSLDGSSLPATRVKGARKLMAAIGGGRYDCVVAGLTGRLALPVTVVSARTRGTPLVLWVGIWAHPATWFHQLSRPVVRRLYRSADALVVYGSHVAAYVEEESGRRERVFVAPQAVDNAAFRAAPAASAAAALREQLGLPNLPVATFVGRLEAEKGLELLLEASSSTLGHALLIVGSGSLERKLREQAALLGLEHRIRFAGYVAQAELPAYLALSDFLVLPSVTTPSFKEPWGLVANEAMNCGLPVVATDAVGAAAGGLVVHDETGLVVPERDARALAAALDALARDAALRARLGATAAERVLAFNYTTQADGFEQAVGAAVWSRRGLACAS
jgi:glycosyltransferase involved in cell wall biosynthesis